MTISPITPLDVVASGHVAPDKRRLFSKRSHPYYIQAFDYRRTSAGVRVMHMLCDALNRSGYEAYAVANVLNPELVTPSLTPSVIQLHKAQGIEPITVYPEIVDGNPLGGRTVVRYLLNQPGFIEGKGEYAADDIRIAYTRALLPEGLPEDRVLFLPAIDLRIFHLPEDPDKRIPGKVCYYQGRRGQAPIDQSKLPADAVEITSRFPESWEALADLFQQCEYFYCTEASGLCGEAALCGCLAIVLPNEWAPLSLAREEIRNYGIAWGDDAQELARAKQTQPLLRETLLQQQRDFWPALDRFIDLTQSIAEQRTGNRHLMSEWLTRRAPNAVQSLLISEHLATRNPQSIGILVSDADGNHEAVRRTLSSLDRVKKTVPGLRTVVLTTQEAVAQDDSKHRFVRLDGTTMLQAVNHAVAEEDFDWLLMVDAGNEFTESGLPILALELHGPSHPRAVYADELMRDDDGNLSALLRPDFNLDLALSMPSSMARHWIFNRKAFIDAGGFDPAHADSPELDLILRMIDMGGMVGLEHVHEPLLITPSQQIASKPSEQESILRHLRHRGYEQARIEPTLPGCYRIHYGHQGTPGVSIIIPTRNQFKRLVRCIDTLIEKTAYKNYEILIVDNGSTEEDACTWLAGIEAMNNPQMRVLHYPQPFNYAAMNNLAAGHARGEYLLLLNNDTAIVREDWLDAMLNHAQRPEVGVVGAKLIDLDGKVQSAGLIACLPTPAQQPFVGDSPDGPGYMYRLQVDQDYSAVTGACMMVRKSLYDEAGGLDEAKFPVSHGDIDLCLKLRHAGYLVVWTPHAVLLHEGSVSQAAEDKASTEDKAKRFAAGQDALYDRWLPTIAHDPAYNDNLSLNGKAFLVETHPPVTWNPLTWRPLPVALAFAADQAGCGHYRILQPSAAMREFGVATVDVCHRYLSPVEMERASPDTMVLQRQMTEDQIKLQKRVARFNKCFKVAELDDYLPQVPRKSAHHGTLPKDILKTMRKSLTLVDRFVVSTQGLAEMMQGMHPDIRVVENHLPLHWWADVKGERRTGRKPRVGWGGAAGHRGDLELIADVVEALSDEVEWVFFGMCPDKLKPFVHEIVQPVAIGDYPGRLASLNLDLAIAPLEDNTFNQCKSNLRLLEYGACGFPVVCSDVRPYQCDLPVTRVKPRFKEWTEAIRMHVNDLDAAAKAGDALREAIHRDWMLDEKHARFWLSQWMPD